MPKSLDAGCSFASYFFYNTSIPRCLPQTILGEIREEEDEILPRKDYEVRNILNDIFLERVLPVHWILLPCCCAAATL